jgi:hypothetical protein
MVTEAENGEIKAPRARRDKEGLQHGTNSDKRRRTGQPSGQALSQSFATDRDDWAGGNFAEQCGQAVLGGIIDRLISKTIDLIDESENRTADLKKHLRELKELSIQFRQKSDHQE